MANAPEVQSDTLYAAYSEWKGWQSPFICPPDMAGYFRGELRGRSLRGASVLEIGFGNGEFLGFARSEGASITGCEITTASIHAAQKEGIALIPADFETDAQAYAASFDVIAAYDVFEHLDPPTIMAKLTAIAGMLKPGGWLILRYPNGQSPFGLAAQHGDATHIVALSRAKMDLYANGTGLKTIAYGGVARTHGGSIAKKAVRQVRYVLRDAHKAAVRFMYGMDAELEPVVVQVLEKA
jgi:2-polyprenyl-3-methyl-5-hydroxy-6-metoxy-1,4-benzoquinol methylase